MDSLLVGFYQVHLILVIYLKALEFDSNIDLLQRNLIVECFHDLINSQLYIENRNILGECFVILVEYGVVKDVVNKEIDEFGGGCEFSATVKD